MNYYAAPASEAELKCYETEECAKLVLVDLERAIERGDLEIQCIIERERALRTHKATLVPVSRIPSEIFTMVFRLCTPTPKNPNPTFPQACSQWRTLTLKSVVVAYTHHLLPVFAIRDAVARKRLPLDSVRTAVEAGAVEHLELKISHNTDQSRVVSRLLLKKLRLLLKSLGLQNVAYGYVLPPSDQEETLLPFPLLRHLRLVDCTLRWELQCFPNLTTLEQEALTRLDLAAVVAIPRSSPKLESLECYWMAALNKCALAAHSCWVTGLERKESGGGKVPESSMIEG
ncbi:hypothetical protein BC835DRAFT_1529318 [Cytidiella melzeri]|nr:hypothetical protein BC835DRAFT_1529318 [Cytidiella melzeri]